MFFVGPAKVDQTRDRKSHAARFCNADVAVREKSQWRSMWVMYTGCFDLHDMDNPVIFSTVAYSDVRLMTT